MVSRLSDKDILLGDAACLFIAGALAGLSIWGIARERNWLLGCTQITRRHKGPIRETHVPVTASHLIECLYEVPSSRSHQIR